MATDASRTVEVKIVHITLKPDRNQFIEAQVKSGKYSSVDEVIAAALELL
jgi:antitoxin ParD1/3/4